jgi:galactokinase/mevalonate kinase-like predicted kinase
MGELAGLYEQSGGPVLCAATGYSVYAFLAPSRLDGVQVTFAGRHVQSGGEPGEGSKPSTQLDLLQSIVRRFGSFGSQQVFVASQFPQVGAMLQGSLAVATLKAIAFRCGLDLEPQALAQLACDIGSGAPGDGVGYVHFAAALGGLCALTRSSGKTLVEPLDVTPALKRDLEERLMVFVALNHERALPGMRALTGNHRTERREEPLDLAPVKELVWAARSELERGDLDAFGRLLHRLWIARHTLVERDSLLGQGYESAIAVGALGGSVTSGGDGACLVLYCPVECQGAVAEKLATYGFECWPLALEDEGVYALQGVPWSRSETGTAGAWLQPFASPTTFAQGRRA